MRRWCTNSKTSFVERLRISFGNFRRNVERLRTDVLQLVFLGFMLIAIVA